MTKPGEYVFNITNQESLEARIVYVAEYLNCQKFKQVVQKTHMDDINSRADKAINTLFHNVVELE